MAALTEKEIEYLSYVRTGDDIGWIKIYDDDYGEETAHLIVSEVVGRDSGNFTITAQADNQEVSGTLTVVMECTEGVLKTTLSAHIYGATGEETVAIRELRIQW